MITLAPTTGEDSYHTARQNCIRRLLRHPAWKRSGAILAEWEGMEKHETSSSVQHQSSCAISCNSRRLEQGTQRGQTIPKIAPPSLWGFIPPS